jgi:hypothetical protein
MQTPVPSYSKDEVFFVANRAMPVSKGKDWNGYREALHWAEVQLAFSILLDAIGPRKSSRVTKRAISGLRHGFLARTLDEREVRSGGFDVSWYWKQEHIRYNSSEPQSVISPSRSVANEEHGVESEHCLAHLSAQGF